MKSILTTTDFILMPFFALVIYFLAKLVRDRRYKNDVIKKYFIPALMFRLLGAFLTALMYQYYYKFGDTFYYFVGASDIYNMFWHDPVTGLEMIFEKYQDLSLQAKSGLTYHRLFSEPSTGTVMQLGGLVSIFSLGTFIGISFYMTVFAFAGCWLLFKVFYDIYPHLHKPLAYATLFLPSLCFWGTGLMKDSLTMGGLGMLVYGMYHLFIKRNMLIRSVIFIALGGYLTAQIKVYILLCIMPAMVLWVFMMYRTQIKNRTVQRLLGPLLFVVGIGGGAVALQQIGQRFEAYSLENILVQAEKTQWWLKVSTERDGGTGYSLGTITPTPLGLLRLFPTAVNVTLFRPYPWEARKPIVIPSAIESLFSLIFTLFVFFKIGIWKTLKTIVADPVVLFCLVFSIAFAFAVGFSTLNFGSLARYKIPCLPFYFVAMIVVWDKGKAEMSKLKTLKSTISNKKLSSSPSIT